jgi:hypothetical protein
MLVVSETSVSHSSMGGGGLLAGVQEYLARKKMPTPLGPPWDPGTGLRQGPRGGRFLTREIPLYDVCASLGFGVCGVGVGDWGLGVGVWGLGISSLGFGV